MNKSDKVNILIVDDRPENLLAMESILEDSRRNIVKATSGNQALGYMIEYDFAVVLLDVQMPDMDGFETAALMKSSEKTCHIPIIFVTAISKEQRYVLKGYETGAVDYLFKPVNPDILRSKVAVFLELYQQKTYLETTGKELKKVIEHLKKANQRIIKQQKAVIEEERLKLLLQLAGATAHELNQPLTAMLSTIDLIDVDNDSPVQLAEDLAAIKESGLHIASIVRKMQSTNHHDRTKPILVSSSIENLDKDLTIMSVEDSDLDFESINYYLENQDRIKLVRAVSIGNALQLISENEFDLIFLDYILPDGDALSFLRILERKGIDTPVVVITGQGDEMIASQLIQAGVYDYLPKNRVSDVAIARAISNTMEKVRLQREIRESHVQMAVMSTKDELTDLYNRRYFMDALERAVSGAKRNKNDLVLCMMDLDHFKEVNDTYGHIAGDMVLTEIGKQLKDCFRESDLSCRYGGEELATILPNTHSVNAVKVCERLRQTVADHAFSHEGKQFSVTLSIGIAPLSNVTSGQPSELVSLADKALYQAKNSGRNRVVLSSSP